MDETAWRATPFWLRPFGKPPFRRWHVADGLFADGRWVYADALPPPQRAVKPHERARDYNVWLDDLDRCAGRFGLSIAKTNPRWWAAWISGVSPGDALARTFDERETRALAGMVDPADAGG